MSQNIIIITDDGQDQIATTEGFGVEQALEAHGYESDTADYTVE